MKRKLLSVLLVLAMAAAVPLAGGAAENLPLNEDGNPDPYGKYAEPITIEAVLSVEPTDSMPEGQSATDNMYTRYIKDTMNIDVKYKWIAGTNDYTQKMSLAIASNDIPDIMVVSEKELKQLVEADMIQDLTEVWDEYASDTVKNLLAMAGERALDIVTFDEKMMAIPSIPTYRDSYALTWIRQDWLDELGLEMPTDLESLKETARIFMENKMGGENTIGILGPSVNGSLYGTFNAISGEHTLDPIFSAFDAFPGYWIEDESGEVTYGSLTEETKAALQELNAMYEDGILDQELGARENANEAWKAGQTGIMTNPWWIGYSMPDALAVDPDASWVATLLGDEEGTYTLKENAPTGGRYFVVRKGYEHPEAAIVLLNYLRREELNFPTDELNIKYWPGRIVFAAFDDIDFGWRQMMNQLEGKEIEEFDGNQYVLLDFDLEHLPNTKLEPYDNWRTEYWNTDDVDYPRLHSILVGHGAVMRELEAGTFNGVSSVTYSTTETMDKKWDNLYKKESELFLRIIIGEESIDAFDSWVDTWYAEGGEEITAEVQAIADAQ